MQAHRRNGGIPPHILNFEVSWRAFISLTPGRFTSRGNCVLEELTIVVVKVQSSTFFRNVGGLLSDHTASDGSVTVLEQQTGPLLQRS